eukprot:m.48627 g.48627  ORF g.48627 m.48627 type:complete len:121 (-) comp10846_c0_seq4:3-365(-)
MPKHILLSYSALSITSIYRAILAHTLAEEQKQKPRVPPVSDPLLCGFPLMMDSPPLINLFLRVWENALKSLKKGERNDQSHVWMFFKIVFTEKVKGVCFIVCFVLCVDDTFSKYVILPLL